MKNQMLVDIDRDYTKIRFFDFDYLFINFFIHSLTHPGHTNQPIITKKKIQKNTTHINLKDVH